MTIKANQDIRDYMEDRGVNQTDLGDRLGVHNATISLSRLLCPSATALKRWWKGMWPW